MLILTLFYINFIFLQKKDMDENEVAKIVVDSAYQIHKTLGPGLLEKAYEECLCYELRKRGLMVEKEKLLPIIYDDLKIENAYRIDLLVENIFAGL